MQISTEIEHNLSHKSKVNSRIGIGSHFCLFKHIQIAIDHSSNGHIYGKRKMQLHSVLVNTKANLK